MTTKTVENLTIDRNGHNKKYTLVLDTGVELKGSALEIAIKLRKPPYEYSMGVIGNLLNQTRGNISRILQGTGYAGRLLVKKPKFDDTIFDYMRDEDISKKFKLPISYVSERRKKLGIKQPPKINLAYRQRLLCETVFGDEFQPGKQFKKIIQILVNNLFTTNHQRNLVMGFYFDGDISTPSNKVYRHELRQQLKNYVSVQMTGDDLMTFIKKGVLIKKSK